MMASSGSAVVVLTPNGRRQTIKVSPNTPLLQVLEEVCRNHGFNPEDHGLKFQRSVLNLTLPWRFANLPNNAKLEMVTTTRKQAESQVRIALQMEDGSRLQDSFSSGQSLWELLTHFPQISPSELSASGSTPVCVYMRDEVCGENALKKATLKSLGLTGGSAIVRFLFKKEKPPEDDNDMAQTAALPTTPVAKETPPTLPPQPEMSPRETSTAEVKNESLSLDTTGETSETATCVSDINTLPVPDVHGSNSQNAAMPESQSAETQMSGEDGEQAGPSGINCHPSSSPTFSAPFIPFSGGGQRLGGPCGGGALGPSCTSLSALTAALDSPKAKKAKSSYSSNTKSKPTAASPVEDFNFGDEFAEPVEREPLIYHLESISHQSVAHGDLPDEFFEVTVDDVRKRFAQLKSERKLLEEAPLMTKSSREAQMKEKLDRYPKVVLRVQFPDRYVLQGFFRPLETVDAVRHFVRSHLEDPQLSFYLFIAPPKTPLENHTATLFQANLFPGALIYFGCNEKTDFYIKKELLESTVTAWQANKTIASCMIKSTPTCSSAEDDEVTFSPEPSMDAGMLEQDTQTTAALAPMAKPGKSDPGKVPKWLKLPGKK